MTAKGGPFMADVEADCRVGRSAKVVSEARVARTGCIRFLMQACHLIVYYNTQLKGVECHYLLPTIKAQRASLICIFSPNGIKRTGAWRAETTELT
jgi:hypothetical protein